MFLDVVQCRAGTPSEEGIKAYRPTIALASVKITHREVEVRCEMENQGEEDIWVFGENLGLRDLNSARGTNARLFIDPDSAALLILRRMNTPRTGVMGERVSASYRRLRPGESLPQVFSIILPVATATDRIMERTLSGMTGRGVETLARLVFEVGYYSAQDLHSMENPGGYQYVSFDVSCDHAILRDYVEMGVWNRERAVKIAVDGVSVPLRRWLEHEKEVQPEIPVEMLTKLSRVFFQNKEILPASACRYAERLFRFDPDVFDDTARRLADLFVQLTQGNLAPSEFMSRLDDIADKASRDKLLDDLYTRQMLMSAPAPPDLTQLQVLDDLFYAFRLSLEEYRYGRQLLSLDESLFDDVTRRIARVYRDVIKGDLAPSELTPRLDRILNRDAREQLIDTLCEKKGEAGSDPDGLLPK